MRDNDVFIPKYQTAKSSNKPNICIKAYLMTANNWRPFSGLIHSLLYIKNLYWGPTIQRTLENTKVENIRLVSSYTRLTN